MHILLIRGIVIEKGQDVGKCEEDTNRDERESKAGFSPTGYYPRNVLHQVILRSTKLVYETHKKQTSDYAARIPPTQHMPLLLQPS